MTEIPKRRWFRFSLRTLFVAVTIVGLWFAWQARWIQARREFMARHQALAVDPNLEIAPSFSDRLVIYSPHHVDWETRFILSLFGEQPRQFLTLVFVTDGSRSLSDEHKAEIERAEHLFPEAKIDWDFSRPRAELHREQTGLWMQRELVRLDPPPPN